MKPMIIPNRASIFDTNESTNIGMVVSNGAKSVQRISAALEIFASSYSVSPSSSSLVWIFYTVSTLKDACHVYLTLKRLPKNRWYTRSSVSPVQRSNRSPLLCLGDKTKKSFFVSLSRPSPTFHTSEPGPRREEPLPVLWSSQLRNKLKSCLLGPFCLVISIYCSNALFMEILMTLPKP